MKKFFYLAIFTLMLGPKRWTYPLIPVTGGKLFGKMQMR